MDEDKITLDFECSECGASLLVSHDYPEKIKVAPCSDCLDEKYEGGYEDGKDC